MNWFLPILVNAAFLGLYGTCQHGLQHPFNLDLLRDLKLSEGLPGPTSVTTVEILVHNHLDASAGHFSTPNSPNLDAPPEFTPQPLLETLSAGCWTGLPGHAVFVGLWLWWRRRLRLWQRRRRKLRCLSRAPGAPPLRTAAGRPKTKQIWWIRRKFHAETQHLAELWRKSRILVPTSR